MSAIDLYSLSPITLNATTIPIANLNRSPDNDVKPQAHSGNLFPSIMTAPSAAPRFQFRTPFITAFNLIGFGVLKLTTLNVFLAKFVDFQRSASSVHRKYALAASATGCARITGFTVEKNGVCWADVEVILLSSDGLVHPLAVTDNNALPSVASEPALHTLGPIKINGTTIGGVASLAVDLGHGYEVEISDGDRFARNVALLSGAPTISGAFDGPETAGSTLGQEGVAISANFQAFLRDYDTTTGLQDTDGISLTIASGRIIPTVAATEYGQIAKGGFMVHGLSSSATHPIVVATGQTVPTP